MQPDTVAHQFRRQKIAFKKLPAEENRHHIHNVCHIAKLGKSQNNSQYKSGNWPDIRDKRDNTGNKADQQPQFQPDQLQPDGVI